jgi:hypothetical protein
MTAIIGKLITLNEFNMVWHRMLITSFVFLLVPTFKFIISKLNKKKERINLSFEFKYILNFRNCIKRLIQKYVHCLKNIDI